MASSITGPNVPVAPGVSGNAVDASQSSSQPDTAAEARKAAHKQIDQKLADQTQTADKFQARAADNFFSTKKADVVEIAERFADAFSPETVAVLEAQLGGKVNPESALRQQAKLANDPLGQQVLRDVRIALDDGLRLRQAQTNAARDDVQTNGRNQAQVAQPNAPSVRIAARQGDAPNQVAVPDVSEALATQAAAQALQKAAATTNTKPQEQTAAPSKEQKKEAPPKPPPPPNKPAAAPPMAAPKAPQEKKSVTDAQGKTPTPANDTKGVSTAAGDSSSGANTGNGGNGSNQSSVASPPPSSPPTPLQQAAAVSLAAYLKTIPAGDVPGMVLAILGDAINDTENDLLNAKKQLDIQHQIADAQRGELERFDKATAGLTGDNTVVFEMFTFAVGYYPNGDMYVQTLPDLQSITGEAQDRGWPKPSDSAEDNFATHAGQQGLQEAEQNGTLHDVGNGKIVGETHFVAIKRQTVQNERAVISNMISSSEQDTEAAQSKLQNYADYRKDMLQQFVKIITARSETLQATVANLAS